MLSLYLIPFWCAVVAAAPVIDEPRINAPGIDQLLSDATGPITNTTQYLAALGAVDSKPRPSNVRQARARLIAAFASPTPSGYIESALSIVAQSLVTSDIESVLAGFGSTNNDNNNNPRRPSKKIFPRKGKNDAPYGQTADEMRRQIYIPPTFTYGKKPPVILIPGTGSRGGNVFSGNLIKLLSGKSYADVVWINPPGFMLADAQQNAETVAYAVNYISGISQNRNVSLIGWSQASLSMQWAMKYWPSARRIVTDQIAISADYHGTVIANFINGAGVLPVPMPPAILQQNYDSAFVQALRKDGGDSAYVPTTTVYSSFFDEIVEPQGPPLGASAFLNDARGVGVTNNRVQGTCPEGTFAGGFNTHESMLSNALTFALIEDALTHDGPGRRSRLNLASVCKNFLAPGLSLEDFLTTESAIPVAGLELLAYFPKLVEEPAVRSYAR